MCDTSDFFPLCLKGKEGGREKKFASVRGECETSMQ
jgi:hypothetical protein